MNKEQFESLPATEKEHYNFCATCNEYYDLRDTDQVSRHVHGVTSDTTPGMLDEIADMSL
jgi:hypothetical protein